MKRLFLLVFIILIGGCGGGNGSNVAVGSSAQSSIAPVLSNLRFTPTAAILNGGGGTVNVSVTFDFADPDGNLSTLTVTTYDAAGRQISTSTDSVQSAAHVNQGSIGFNGIVGTTTLGPFTFKLYATDAVGLTSNILTGAITIGDSPWQVRASMPTPRTELAAASLNGKIYAIGGRNGADHLNTVEIYDPAIDSWTTGTQMPTARAGLVVGVVNGKIYAIGGYDQQGISELATVEEYDPAINGWTAKTPMPTPRRFSAAAVVNGKIYVVGGDSAATALRTIEIYDPATDSWSTGSYMPTARYGLSASAVNGKISVCGGYQEVPAAAYLATVEEYDPAINGWVTRPPMPVARAGLASAVLNNTIWTIGGDNGYAQALSTVNVYDPFAGTWQTKNTMPSGLTSLAVAAVNGKIYAIGSNVLYEYTPGNDPV